MTDFDYRQFIRKRIIELRIKKGVPEKTISELLGYDKSYIQKITSGKAMPSIEGLFRICDYFGITIIEFFNVDIDSDLSGEHKKALEELKALSPEEIEVVRQIKNLLKDK